MQKRQNFANGAAFDADRRYLAAMGSAEIAGWIANTKLPLEMRKEYALSDATDKLHILIGDYTIGADLQHLREKFPGVVSSYLTVAELERQDAQDSASPLFDFEHLDDYMDVLALLSLAILLRREDQMASIHSLFKGSAPDGSDALVEYLLQHSLRSRTIPTTWFHQLPFAHLLDATVDAPKPERESDVKAYLQAWYAHMRGTAWYDSHKKQRPDGAGNYFGYWSFEAAAICYVCGIDDASFRDHLIYPKDLASFARATDDRTPLIDQATRLRCEGGQPCPQAGWWFTPAREHSRQYFEFGAVMPQYSSEYGLTIWQWDVSQAADH